MTGSGAVAQFLVESVRSRSESSDGRPIWGELLGSGVEEHPAHVDFTCNGITVRLIVDCPVAYMVVLGGASDVDMDWCDPHTFLDEVLWPTLEAVARGRVKMSKKRHFIGESRSWEFLDDPPAGFSRRYGSYSFYRA